MNLNESKIATTLSDSSKDENLLVLYVWPGDWDLPSLDPECLTAMVYNTKDFHQIFQLYLMKIVSFGINSVT